MHNQELMRQLQILQSLFNRTGLATGGDIEMQAHWAKYLCILSAGFLENALSEIYGNFVKNAASDPVANYAFSTLTKILNPKCSKFIEIASAFKAQWGEELELYVSDEGRKEALDSIMSNRHLIAHGKNSGITVARLREYLDKSVQVIEYIEEQCNR
jgi:hypothetical protein